MNVILTGCRNNKKHPHDKGCSSKERTLDVQEDYITVCLNVKGVDGMKLFIDNDALDLYKDGYSFYAWSESIKEDGDIEIDVNEKYVKALAKTFGEGNYNVVAGAEVKVINI